MDAWVVWIIVALLAILIEIFTLGFAVASLAAGALAASLVSFLGLGLTWQLALFSLFSLLAMVTIRPLAIRYIKRSRGAKGVETNVNALIGRHAVVSSEIRGGEGRVIVDGDDWKAMIEERDEVIKVGERVEVVDVNSVILTVKKI